MHQKFIFAGDTDLINFNFKKYAFKIKQNFIH